MDSSVKDRVSRILPSLPPNILNKVMDSLAATGVKTINDLPLVEERDLADCLTRIQIRRLLMGLKADGKFGKKHPFFDFD